MKLVRLPNAGLINYIIHSPPMIVQCSRSISTKLKLEEWTRKFEKDNISEPEVSAKYIIAHVLGKKTYSQLSHEKQTCTLNHHTEKKIDFLCEKRLHRLPVQYVIEEWDFGGLTLKMRPPIFIPRPETEELVKCAIADINASPGSGFHLLEVGCGSGAISLALLHAFNCGLINKQFKCTAIDKDTNAINLTKENSVSLHLDLPNLNIIHCDVASIPNMELYDGVISNPPYIPTSDMANLQPEISQYESTLALHGGTDGLDVIREILKKSAQLLRPNGWIWLEVDTTHPEIISKLFDKCKVEEIKLDFMEQPRFVKLSFSH